MAAYVQMKYYSTKYARDMKYNSFVSDLSGFMFLLKRKEIDPEDIKELSINKEKVNPAEIIKKAEAAGYGL